MLPSEVSAAPADLIYQPCPMCARGNWMWEQMCEKCGDCGREFDTNGVLIANARCESDIDGWGTLC